MKPMMNHEEDQYFLDQYAHYMGQHCTCHRSEEDCLCMSYEKFCDTHMEALKDYWEQEAGYDHERELELACQIF